jgi:F0F1-type ATP synthase alpha subunit
VELLKQKKFKPLPIELQTLLIFGGWSGLYDTINKKDIINFVENVINFWTTLSLEYSNNFGGLLSEQFFKHVIDSVKKNATYGNIRKK